LIKILRNNYQKEEKGSPMIEILIIFSLVILPVFIASLFYIYTKADQRLDTMANGMADQVAMQLRGNQDGFGTLDSTRQEYITNIVTEQMIKTKITTYASIFKSDANGRITADEAKALLLVDDKVGCDAKFAAKENVICVYTDTITDGTVQEIVNVRVFSEFFVANALEPFLKDLQTTSTKPLDINIPNANF
jgi:hypothetical protein